MSGNHNCSDATHNSYRINMTMAASSSPDARTAESKYVLHQLRLTATAFRYDAACDAGTIYVIRRICFRIKHMVSQNRFYNRAKRIQTVKEVQKAVRYKQTRCASDKKRKHSLSRKITRK